MTRRLLAWAARLSKASAEEAEYEEWIMTAIAGVLLAKKAGELIVLSPESAGLSVPRQLEVLRSLVCSWQLSSVTVCQSEHCAKVVIYRAELVESMLSDVPRWVLRRLGYPADTKPAAFLDELRRRWRANERMPHEIGFALGYPVKDVLGFMNLVRLPCTGVCGWRIYGNPDPSLRLRREHEKARVQITAAMRASKALANPAPA